jgi:hypothetical protein
MSRQERCSSLSSTVAGLFAGACRPSRGGRAMPSGKRIARTAWINTKITSSQRRPLVFVYRVAVHSSNPLESSCLQTRVAVHSSNPLETSLLKFFVESSRNPAGSQFHLGRLLQGSCGGGGGGRAWLRIAHRSFCISVYFLFSRSILYIRLGVAFIRVLANSQNR